MSGGREPVPASEVQERRWQGQPIEGIASDVGLSRGAVYNAFEKKPGDIMKPRERLRHIATEETVLEEETLEINPLNSLMVGGILVGVPLGILALWFFGNLATGKLKI